MFNAPVPCRSTFPATVDSLRGFRATVITRMGQVYPTRPTVGGGTTVNP